MNKYQRGVLIGTGLAIAAYQIYGIAEDGLEYSEGWAISFLIAAGLLFVGLGDWTGLIAKLKSASPQPPKEQRPIPPSASSKPAPVVPNKPDKHAYGLHISELDLAIASAAKYAEKAQIFHALQGNGLGLHWNSCSLIYAAMRYAATKGKMNISSMVWNTMMRAVIVRMTTEGDAAIPMGTSEYEELEARAYKHLGTINRITDDAIAKGGTYDAKPIVDFLAAGFGARGKPSRRWRSASLPIARPLTRRSSQSS